MITCKELKKDFTSKQEMFKELVNRKADLIQLKKSAIKHTDSTSGALAVVQKAAGQQRALQIGDVMSNVINTTMWLDSHNDLHINGIWNQTVKQQAGKVFHVINHDLSLGSVIGYPGDVELEVRKMTWRNLGYDMDGMTEALIYHTTITDKINIDAFKAYRDMAPVQHSVRMEYVNILLAVNDEDMEEEYKVYQTYLPQIVNRSVAEERGYFWVVTEAKISKEGSTVLFGSNEITPYLGFETGMVLEPLQSTQSSSQAFDFEKALSETQFFK